MASVDATQDPENGPRGPDRRSDVAESPGPPGRFEQRLADIIANSPTIVCIKDLELRYRMASQQLADLLGYPLGEIIGHTASELRPDVGPKVDALTTRALRTGVTVDADVDFPTGDQVRTFRLVSFALGDEAGTPVEVCCFFHDVTDSRHRAEQTRQRREATELIGAALAENRMVLLAQPVVDITGHRQISREILVRLALPDGVGLLEPAAFLPQAEQFGLIQDVDIWMVAQALELSLDAKVQVNLSAVTLSDPSARRTIVAMLGRAPRAARNLVFEITETAAVHHLDAACDFAAALTALGCGLALDDFGTGFGSFTYLRRLPLRYLKIDRSFVTGLAASHDDRRVVSSIIGIAKQFDLWTIAEGVEDADTLRVLGELGADYAQGFLFGRPAPLSAA